MADETDMQASSHAMPYRAYVTVWAGLIALTALTVGVSYVNMKQVSVLTALMIAACKASLVVLYFMHIRFERKIHLLMILVVAATYLIFIGLTFADYAER